MIQFFFSSDFRLFLFIGIIFFISSITLIQIQSLNDSLHKSYEICTMLKLCAEQNFLSLKVYQIANKIIFSDWGILLTSSFGEKQMDIASQYFQNQEQNNQLINQMREYLPEYSIIEEEIFSYQLQERKSVQFLQFLYDIRDAIRGVNAQIGQFQNFALYFLISNFISYSEMVKAASDQLIISFLNRQDQIQLQYSILSFGFIGYLSLILFSGNYFLNKVVKYKKKILLLIARISNDAIERELLFLETSKQELNNSNLSWQKIDFSLKQFPDLTNNEKRPQDIEIQTNENIQRKKNFAQEHQLEGNKILSPTNSIQKKIVNSQNNMSFLNNNNQEQLAHHQSQNNQLYSSNQSQLISPQSTKELIKNNTQIKLVNQIDNACGEGAVSDNTQTKAASDSKMKAINQSNQIKFSKQVATHQNSYNAKVKTKKNATDHKKQGNQLVFSKLQGKELRVWPIYLKFFFTLQLCGLFFLTILVIAYFQTTELEASLSLQRDGSQIFLSLNSALIMSEFIINDILSPSKDPLFPVHNQEDTITEMLLSTNKIKELMNSFLKKLNSISNQQSYTKDILKQIYTSDLCFFFASTTICEEGKEKNLILPQSKLRETLKSGISGLLTSYLQQFDMVKNILSLEQMSDKQELASQYLNEYFYSYLPLASYDIPMNATNLFLQKIIEFNQNQTQSLILSILYSFTIFGAVLITLQFFIDLQLKRSFNSSIKRLNLALTFIPPLIAQEESTNQILKSIFQGSK